MQKLSRIQLIGWEYMGFTMLVRLSKEKQEKLKNKGDSLTIKKKDHYIRYVNNGWITSSSRLPVIDFYRRRFRSYV